jgi:transposase
MTEKRRVIGRGVKLEAVRRIKEFGEAPNEVAQALGVRADQVRHWMKQLGVAAAEGGLAPGRETLTSREREELKALRRENDQLRKEREFLKKAAAYFAKESPDGTP